MKSMGSNKENVIFIRGYSIWVSVGVKFLKVQDRLSKRNVVGNDDSDYYSLPQGENPLSEYSKVSNL